MLRNKMLVRVLSLLSYLGIPCFLRWYV